MKKACVLVLLSLLVVLPILSAGCGGKGAAPGEGGETEGEASTGGPVSQADAAACAANRRAISAAVQQHKAMEGSLPSTLQQLVTKYLGSIPTCPSGGSYSLSGERVTCSVHGT